MLDGTYNSKPDKEKHFRNTRTKLPDPQNTYKAAHFFFFNEKSV